MSAPADGNATIVVIMTEPGIVYVKVAEPMPRADRIEPLLRKTIDHWFSSHPQFVIDRSEAVVENDKMRGIHVWYHDKDLDRRANSDQTPEEPDSVPIEEPDSVPIVVHGEVKRRLPKEYTEAMVDEVLEIFFELEDYRGVLFAISPRRIAVIVDGQSLRVIVIPMELIEQGVDGSTKRKLETWLAAPRGRFYLVHIAASRIEGG